MVSPDRFPATLLGIVNVCFFLYGAFLLFAALPLISSKELLIAHALWINFLVPAFALPYLGIYSTSKRHKPAIYVYVVFVLSSIIFQGGIQYKFRQEYKEQARRQAKVWTLPTFNHQEKSVQDDIQRIQQENGCCGVDSYLDFKGEPKFIPSSCCSKYKEGSHVTVGQCSLDELKDVPGCGDRLSVWLWDKETERFNDQRYAELTTWGKIVDSLYTNYNSNLYFLKVLATIFTVMLLWSIGKRNAQNGSPGFEMYGR